MAKRGGFPGGMGNMNNLMKQAQRMQRQMQVLLAVCLFGTIVLQSQVCGVGLRQQAWAEAMGA